MAKPLAKYIDHTLLKPDATQDQIDEVLAQAKQYGFASVCINPYWVVRAAASLRDTDVNVCTVIGFPLGANTTQTKVFETGQAIDEGAQEIDMVLNIGELKAGHDDHVRADIQAVADMTHASTGFAAGGATVHDVALMRKTVGDKLGVKAAGGIHTYAEAKALIDAGADRLGASAGIQILKEAGEA